MAGSGWSVAPLGAGRRLGDERPLEGMGALGLGSVLASPVSWTHHWLWVVPLQVVTVSRRWWFTSWALGVVFIVGPMALVPMGNFQELSHNWWQAAVSASYILFGIGMLARLLMVKPRRATGPPVSTALETRPTDRLPSALSSP